MSTYSTDSNKGTESTRQTDWHDCGKYKAGPNSGNSPDGLNGSLSLSKQARDATGINQGDEILLKIEANGETLITERNVVGGGRQVTLPVNERRKLNLSVGDVIEYAILPINTKHQNGNESEGRDESEESTVSEGNGTSRAKKAKDSSEEERRNSSDTSSNDSRNEQQTLATDDDDLDTPHVLIKGDDYDPWTYHRVQSQDTRETVCGISYSDEEHRILTDPTGFDLCPFCATQNLEEMDNKQKLRWLGRKAGFKVGDEVAYIKGPQYDALIRYIQGLEDR